MNHYISVVMPAKGNVELCENAIKTLRQHAQSDWQLIFIDNASNPEEDLAHSVQQLMFPKDIFLRNETDRSFAAANNQGVSVASGKIVMLLNNDILAHGDWQTPILEGLVDHQLIGVQARELGKTLKEDGTPWGILQCLREEKGGLRVPKDGDISKPNSYLEGWCLAMQRDYYMQVGGLDETFWPFYGEDSDLCLRVRSFGGKLGVVKAPITHLCHKDTDKYISSDMKNAVGRTNEYKLYARWIEGKIL